MDAASQPQAGADVQDPDKVEIARQALASLSQDDEGYITALNTVSASLLSRFARSGNPDDLDEAISCARQALDLASPGHPLHPTALRNLGQTLVRRFKVRGDASDLTQAFGYLEAAVELSTPEDSDYLPSVASLSSGLLSRYRRYGDLKDLDRIVEISTNVLSVSPPDGFPRDVLFNNFANALKERFMKQGNRADLDAALTHYQSCLDLRPPGHPVRHSALGNFGDAVLLRFETDGHPQDLESAANHFESALQLRSPGQEGYVYYLSSLGMVTLRMYYVLGDAEKVEKAISYYKTAMEHSTVPNLEHSQLLDKFGATLQLRFTLYGDVADLDQAIQYLTTSLNIQPPTYPDRAITLFNLGVTHLNRYNVIGAITDLDSSIENLLSALSLSQPGYQHRPIILSIYGRVLSARFNAKGDMQDLELAASTCKEALALASPKELNYSSTVANLTSTLLECFYRSRNIAECDNVIDYCDHALVSLSPAESAYLTLKINRAKAYLQKFQHGRAMQDIDTTVAAFREIIPTLPEGHAEYMPVHLQFGIALEIRFKLSVDPKDLNESIALYRVAKRSCTRGDHNYVSICMQLGNALRERFEYHQNSGDALDEGIMLLAEVEEILTPTPEHTDYKPALVNLSLALFMRFQAQRRGDDLDEAIEHVSRALTLPASYEDFLVPFSLATMLSTRHTVRGNPEDLEQSVELYATAAAQMPPKHLVRSNLCRNYGHALAKLANRRDALQHLDAAIVLYKEALEHLPPSHADQPLTYMHLAEAQHQRALLRFDKDALYDAMNLLRGVVETLPEDSPVIHAVYFSAAKLSMATYERLEEPAPSFMEDAFRYYEKAAHYGHRDGFTSVVAVLEWAGHADKHHHASVLLAYQTALGSLNRYLLTTASVKNRRAALLENHWPRQISTLATDATACAIARGELELAVELSEQGRGLLWSQMAQSRTPLDALRSTSDEGRTLAADFERVSSVLAQRAVAESTVTASRLTIEEAARQYHQSSQELDDIVARIRRQDGFQSFLDRPSFQDLQRAALGGPVILVNVSSRRCDALVVLRDSPPCLVPLPDTTLDDLAALSAELYHTFKTTTRVGDEKTRERQVAVVLRTLWDTIVHPVVADGLTPLVPRGTRIWWCPTSALTALPLHAAGAYRKGGQNLSGLYISSYTPTLAALIRARHLPPSSSSSPRRTPAFVAIGQTEPANLATATATATRSPSSESGALQTVDLELALVQSLLPLSPSPNHTPLPFTALSGTASTAAAALAALRTHPWAHLACHGHPNPAQPFDASFALRDRGVTLLDLMRNANAGGGGGGGRVSDGDESNGKGDGPEFAFLSACHTAAPDPSAPDETIHLAAAMQYAGFRSVVGTMWAVDDALAHYMVRAFYGSLFARGGSGSGGGRADIGDGDKSGNGDGETNVWDYTRAARALNKASKSVDKDAVPLDQRIVFIHIGA